MTRGHLTTTLYCSADMPSLFTSMILYLSILHIRSEARYLVGGELAGEGQFAEGVERGTLLVDVVAYGTGLDEAQMAAIDTWRNRIKI